MPIPNPPLPKAPAPTKVFFDPFNSSSTGHQTAPSNLAGTTSWRNSRTHKLTSQLRDSSGRGGSRHLSDLVGAGSEHFRKDERKDNGHWEKGAPGLREAGWQDVRGLIGGSQRKRRRLDKETGGESSKTRLGEGKSALTSSDDQHQALHWNPRGALADSARGKEEDSGVVNSAATGEPPTPPPNQLPQVFTGLTIYLNGSTAPLISDHRLRNLFVCHGGKVSLGLARRSVTHVILGDTGLAAGKVQKEVRTIKGESVKYVTAQWVVDSVKAGRRQCEGKYLPKELATGGTRQKSVRDLFPQLGDRAQVMEQCHALKAAPD